MNKLTDESSNGDRCFNINEIGCCDPERLGVGCWWWITVVVCFTLDSQRLLGGGDILLRLEP